MPLALLAAAAGVLLLPLALHNVLPVPEPGRSAVTLAQRTSWAGAAAGALAAFALAATAWRLRARAPGALRGAAALTLFAGALWVLAAPPAYDALAEAAAESRLEAYPNAWGDGSSEPRAPLRMLRPVHDDRAVAWGHAREDDPAGAVTLGPFPFAKGDAWTVAAIAEVPPGGTLRLTVDGPLDCVPAESSAIPRGGESVIREERWQCVATSAGSASATAESSAGAVSTSVAILHAPIRDLALLLRADDALATLGGLALLALTVILLAEAALARGAARAPVAALAWAGVAAACAGWAWGAYALAGRADVDGLPVTLARGFGTFGVVTGALAAAAAVAWWRRPFDALAVDLTRYALLGTVVALPIPGLVMMLDAGTMPGGLYAALNVAIVAAGAWAAWTRGDAPRPDADAAAA